MNPPIPFRPILVLKYWLLTALTAGPASILMAQSSEEIADTLRETVVSYRAGQKTPVSFQNIASAYIDARSVGQEPAFLLTETPSVTCYSDAGHTQGYAYFRMRGIDQTRINITLDGVPLNEPEDQGAYFSNYPDLWNSIGLVQIQRGVGTTKNGVANYGGSIQLFSMPFSDTMHASIGGSYGSFNSYRTFGEYQSGTRKGKALYARVSGVGSDGYKYHSGNRSRSAFLSGGWVAGRSHWKINLLGGQQRNKMAWQGVAEPTLEIDPRTNANSPQESDAFTQCLAQIQHAQALGTDAILQSSLYYTFLDGNYDFDFNNFLGLPSTSELYNYAFRSHLQGFFSNYTLNKRQLNWTTGVHANRYQRQHTGSERALGKLYQNTGYRTELSAFSRITYSINTVHGFADLQYRYAAFEYQGSVPLNKMYWQFLNPKAGISYTPDQFSSFYYSIGRTGREPTRNDLFGGNDDLLADSLGLPVLSVKSPEYVLDQELGWRYQNTRLKGNINAYWMDFENEIVLDGKFGPNGLALTNKVEQSIRTGLELVITWMPHRNWTLNHASSLNYSRIKEQNEVFKPILTPPLMVFQEIEYQWKGWSCALSVRYQGASFIDFANSARVPAYILMNGRAGFARKGLSVRLFAGNLTNTRYFNNGYVDYDGSKKLFVQAPANVNMALQYSF